MILNNYIDRLNNINFSDEVKPISKIHKLGLGKHNTNNSKTSNKLLSGKIDWEYRVQKYIDNKWVDIGYPKGYNTFETYEMAQEELTFQKKIHPLTQFRIYQENMRPKESNGNIIDIEA